MKRGAGLRRRLIVLGSAGRSIADGSRALAPFIYAIYQLRFFWSSVLGALSLVRCPSSF
jgi:hypothetical protein